MLDLRFVRDHLPEVEQALKNRGMALSLDDFHLHDGERRRLLTQMEELRHQRNTLSQSIGGLLKAGNPDEARALKDRVAAINEEVRDLEAQAAQHDAWLQDFLLTLPNLPHASVPLGAGSDDNPDTDPNELYGEIGGQASPSAPSPFRKTSPETMRPIDQLVRIRLRKKAASAKPRL